ncbi:MAG: hypothetical protein WAL61_08475 [Acidimicrobiales bacterium]
MGDTYAMDETAVMRDVTERVGRLSDDEAALVRTLMPALDTVLNERAREEHLLDLVDLLATVRQDEAMAEYVYAIAPSWDGTIETLLLGGRVTTAFTRIELESCGATPATGRRAPVRRRGLHRVPTPVG